MTPVAVCACVTTLFSQQAKAASWCDLEISQGGPPRPSSEAPGANLRCRQGVAWGGSLSLLLSHCTPRTLLSH